MAPLWLVTKVEVVEPFWPAAMALRVGGGAWAGAFAITPGSMVNEVFAGGAPPPSAARAAPMPTASTAVAASMIVFIGGLSSRLLVAELGRPRALVSVL